MKEIQLSKGFIALVDDEDYERVNAFKWFVKIGSHSNYAARHIQIGKKRKTIFFGIVDKEERELLVLHVGKRPLMFFTEQRPNDYIKKRIQIEERLDKHFVDHTEQGKLYPYTNRAKRFFAVEISLAWKS